MNPTFAIDVGGTWIRSRSLPDSATVVRTRTPSVLNHPSHPVAQLREDLVAELAELAPPHSVVAISCGAAMDESRGVVYGSAPLWGGETRPYNLLGALEYRRRDVHWSIVNDVTAALADFADRWAPKLARHVGYLTVSSGIGYRQVDWRTGEIAVDAWGLQGEVGHALAQTSDPIAMRSLCDCGQPGHLAALSSGPAIERMSRSIRPDLFVGCVPGPESAAVFTAAIERGESWARQVLAVAVEPVAELLRTMWRITPHLDLIGLGGGVVEGLGSAYREQLFSMLAERTNYSEPPRTRAWLEEHVRVCADGDVDSLAGAASMQAGRLKVVR